MKTHKNLFAKVYSFQNLLLAYKKAQRGTKKTAETTDFFFNLEPKLIELSESIKSGSYQPAPYSYFTIYEPKQRVISVAPFVDRVVHHAIVNILEPIYEKIFINHSYATRKNKGTIKAVYKAQEYLAKNKWFLKNDIKKYFANINQQILVEIISKKISDKKMLFLISKIISNGGVNSIGLPIGNLTSQFFANVYLNELDYFVKHTLQCKYYIRYMDDFVIFNNNKEILKDALLKLENFILYKLNLSLKEKAIILNQQLNGLSFLGTRIFPSTIRIKSENLKRIKKRMNEKEYLFYKKRITEDNLIETFNSYNAFFYNYDTFSIKRIIFAPKGV